MYRNKAIYVAMVLALSLNAEQAGASHMGHSHTAMANAAMQNMPAAALSISDAIANAKKHIKGVSDIKEASFNSEHGGSYEVTLIAGNHKHEFDISNTGSVIKHTHKALSRSDANEYQAQKSAKISSDKAMAIAIQTLGGRVLAVEFDLEKQMPVYDLKVAAKDGKMYELRLNANTGAVLKQALDY